MDDGLILARGRLGEAAGQKFPAPVAGIDSESGACHGTQDRLQALPLREPGEVSAIHRSSGNQLSGGPKQVGAIRALDLTEPPDQFFVRELVKPRNPGAHGFARMTAHDIRSARIRHLEEPILQRRGAFNGMALPETHEAVPQRRLMDRHSQAVGEPEVPE
jgi:hypothetical protein